ncbi:response regulator transcription factor [Pedobacter nutrimenti]|uniref:DNA-binding response OmpR family regulator n=1 Tax=Pedobacter nutrimenti TaxID=1241337 RepID=A0A318UBF5_9SPHI|nr:response regulator transcription factor [Pedobacter nutrimenti]PYF72863.1 DNA-binding response OmpR family regulator [Pedobacter nutrimenti]
MMQFLLIEDDQRMAELIKRGLEEHDFTVDLATDGLTGRTLALNHNYSLIITDVIVPHISGLELCKEIRRKNPDVPILMLTALGTTDDKVEGFDAGADDYLVKPFEMRELMVRIRSLLKRNRAIENPAGSVLKTADLEMNLHTKIVTRNGLEIGLTPKEFKLLEYMMQNPGKVLSRMEIAENVWETHFDTGTNFIDVYINYLRKKVDKDFSQKLIHTKSGMGFVLRTEP